MKCFCFTSAEEGPRQESCVFYHWTNCAFFLYNFVEVYTTVKAIICWRLVSHPPIAWKIAAAQDLPLCHYFGLRMRVGTSRWPRGPSCYRNGLSIGRTSVLLRFPWDRSLRCPQSSQVSTVHPGVHSPLFPCADSSTCMCALHSPFYELDSLSTSSSISTVSSELDCLITGRNVRWLLQSRLVPPILRSLPYWTKTKESLIFIFFWYTVNTVYVRSVIQLLSC